MYKQVGQQNRKSLCDGYHRIIQKTSSQTFVAINKKNIFLDSLFCNSSPVTTEGQLPFFVTAVQLVCQPISALTPSLPFTPVYAAGFDLI